MERGRESFSTRLELSFRNLMLSLRVSWRGSERGEKPGWSGRLIQKRPPGGRFYTATVMDRARGKEDRRVMREATGVEDFTGCLCCLMVYIHHTTEFLWAKNSAAALLGALMLLLSSVSQGCIHAEA